LIVYAENIPVWVAVLVVLVIVATAVVAWAGARRTGHSLFDARKAARVSFLFGAALAGWLALAFLLVFLPRPENAPPTIGAVIVLAWNLALTTVGFGLRFFSVTYREVVDRIPQQLLLAFQSYRLGLPVCQALRGGVERGGGHELGWNPRFHRGSWGRKRAPGGTAAARLRRGLSDHGAAVGVPLGPDPAVRCATGINRPPALPDQALWRAQTRREAEHRSVARKCEIQKAD
jgi:hypothetical protein